MPDILTIPKTSSFPPYLDFSQLRAAGIRHIENLGSDLWTDYNVHDPGITILEVLCYALTDLGYRTNFDFKDLLTRSTEAKNGADKTIFQLPFDDNFFTAAEVLSCNPVTIDDLRKLLIDIPGVKNAWFQKAPEGEYPIFLNRKLKTLQLNPYFPGDDQKDRLFLRGLYDVCVELDDLLVTDACGRTFFSRNDILKNVYAVLHAHRNLCEDMREVLVLGDEQIAVCADIELLPNADPEDVLLEIYKRVEEFLSPTLRFYTLQEMLAKGIPVEEIFAGRPLTATSHGFVDLNELKKMEMKDDLHVSDIYQVIMDIPGIAAVRNLALANYIDDVAFTKGEKWCLPLKPYYRPHFYFKESQITFFKGVLPFSARKEEVSKRYNEEKAAKKKAYLDPYQLDLPIPEGTYRDLEEYTSIMEEFPLTYGVGEAGIKQLPTSVRQGQAKQMKGYLLFFDQLLANYLAQLAHLRDLFSTRPDEDKAENHTYFTHVLNEVPGIAELVKNFNDCTANDADAPPPEDYPSYLQYIAESLETYQERRNRFLDHLLARFAESFADYVLLSYKLEGGKIDPARIIQDKADFLSNYPAISRNRGKGMDYTATPVWDTDNISGLEKRVSKLIGIDNAARHTLAHTRLVETVAGWGAEILDAESNEAVMTSKAVWPTDAEACAAVKSWANLIGSEQNYRRLNYDVAGDAVYEIQIAEEQVDQDTKEKELVILARGLELFPSTGKYCEAVDAYTSNSQNYSLLEIDKQTRKNDDGKLYFVITDSKGVEFLRSENVYDEGDANFKADFDKVISYLLQEKYYCRADFPVSHNNEYGFVLLDSTGSIIAESTKRYLLPAERDAVIHGLINFINLPGLQCSWDQETNCFYFQLYDYTGEKQLFVSQNGFTSKLEAKAFFDTADTSEDFKGWAVQIGHYEKTEKDGRLSFRLKDKDIADPAGTVKAVHPHDYGTEQERDDRLQAIIYYLDEVPPAVEIEEEKAGDFQFDITDASGTVLLKSTHHYPTQVEAENGAWRTRMQARHRVYYKPNTTSPYSFTIVDRHGDEIAYHPHSYNTECERDLAIDTLIYGSQNIDVQHRVEEQTDGFHYILLNPEGDALMTGLTGYPNAPAAEADWPKFLDWAEQKDNYHITEEAGAEHPFGFDLWNDDGQAVAVSVKKYATEAEAKMAIRAIRNYVCHTEWTTVITGEPGIYWFLLIGVNNRVLLRSAVSYPDEPTAKLAYQSALPPARDKNSYFNLPGFGFDLRDADGKTIALHPQQYANDDERNAAINLIISYVRTDAPWIKTPNTGGAFYGIILGPDAEPAFTGTTIHPNWKAAYADVQNLLLLATDRDNYLPHADSYTACRFGFYLTDATGVIVANHPKTYPGPAERDEAMLTIFSWLTHGEALTDDVVQGKPDFRFALKNQAGQRVLISTTQFDTPAEAEEAFDPCLANAGVYERYEKFTDGPTGKFGFRLKDEQNARIARHDTLYPTEEAREEAIEAIILFVTLHGAAYRIFEETGAWKYALQNAAGTDILIDSIGTPDKSTVAENLKQAFVWAQEHERYLLLDDDAACTFGFALSDTDDVEIAGHPDTYGSEDLRDAAIDAFIGYLTQLTIAPEIFEVQGTFYFQLTDFTGKILLKSKKDDFPTVAATKNAWNQLVQAVNDPANFQIVYDNANCLYSVGILVNGQVIACPPCYFSNRNAVNEWINTLVFLIKKQPANIEIPGTTCGYYYVVGHTADGITTTLAGARRYPTPADAERACHEMAMLLRSENTFKIEQTDDTWLLVVYDAAGVVVAKSTPPLFESEADAEAVYDEIIQKLSQTTEILCNPVFREHEYRCSLFDEDGIVLEHTPGKPFTRFGRSESDWASRTVRDAMMNAAVAYFNNPFSKAFELEYLPAGNGKVRYAVIVEIYKELNGKSSETVPAFKILSEKTFDSETAAKNDFLNHIEDYKAAANYQPIDDGMNCRYSIEIIDANVRENACRDCNQLLELAQIKERYSFISNEEECLFGFELTDREGIPLAVSPEFFKTVHERDAAIDRIIQRVNGEGMHLVEHILLRPRKIAVEPRYIVEFKDISETILLLRCIDSFDSEASATQTLWKVLSTIWRAANGETALIRKVRENPVNPPPPDTNTSCWLIEVLEQSPTADNPAPRVLARSPEGFCEEADCDAVKVLIEALVDGPIDENDPPKILPSFAEIQPLPRLYDDLEKDDLLPLIGDCADPARQLPPDLSDPYSFRATVVLPYWPDRFQNKEFRSFLETTLRQEAPAHVFLRICWVDACQMREFETAFRRWLKTKAAGEQSCDASAALNALIDILFRLRNIYPAGTLHDCSETSSNANPIVLNYSIIGSANS